jgi:LuxR family maltose regulon positive regulatory protein
MERPRVIALLEKAIENPVVFVTAGEGYGKTSAVHSFLRRRNKGAVWIPFSECDNDPPRFWESVIKAEGFNNRRIQKVLEEIGFPETPEQINRCYQVLSEDISGDTKRVTVVDDCHFIRNETILNFIKQLLALPFPQRVFILISRTEPELNSMTLLSKGLLSRITTRDLRFNEEEIGAYFRQRNIELSEEDTKNILTDTEGWARALN